MTQQEQADLFVEAFEMLESWDERYAFLIDLARKLPPFPDDQRTEENYVHGCQSKVWIYAHPNLQAPLPALDFEADSDGIITKGLIAMLHRLYAGRTPREILEFDIDGLLTRLGLDQYLSLGRRNGLYSMLQRIKGLAAGMEAHAAAH